MADSIRLSLIEMDARHRTYGELKVTQDECMIRIGIRSNDFSKVMSEYAANLGAHDAIRLANWILTAAIEMLAAESRFDPSQEDEARD